MHLNILNKAFFISKSGKRASPHRIRSTPLPKSSTNIRRSIANLPLELLRVQRSVDAFAIFVEHTVRTDLLGRPGLCARVKVHAKDAGQQQIDQTELQLNCDRPASGPKQEVDDIDEIGEEAARLDWWRLGGGRLIGSIVIGIGEGYGRHLVVGRGWWLNSGRSRMTDFPGAFGFFISLYIYKRQTKRMCGVRIYSL